jgi:hypothetical protein
MRRARTRRTRRRDTCSTTGVPLPPETAEEYPGAIDTLRRVVVIPWTEHHREEHSEYVADMIREALESPADTSASGASS